MNSTVPVVYMYSFNIRTNFLLLCLRGWKGLNNFFWLGILWARLGMSSLQLFPRWCSSLVLCEFYFTVVVPTRVFGLSTAHLFPLWCSDNFPQSSSCHLILEP